ncbi:UDP-N-acetylmuramoyl-L-alanine--D-glutamate ligase [Bifidobacterium xylocopae]|uniref:UDP-N-acetylmuramoylalanine--D-glutamate ligase n=1 Tax=Bifidobacterium xylocopae TaxID=2493119 RepID=A0A366KER3_9BIFI|nr:UDP-N-acetylmuramoyl-L-alanine--D-glutamate ligase [Bifidobacterium xylocopae]RBP99161.1 UDP-N-acetylmuramoyl-L-alanine--D-glutamate ligase [Bifidobacterium xylocopae]
MDVNGKRVLVAGLGVSGRSAVQALQGHAKSVTSVDEHSAAADLHSFDQVDWNQVDLVMASPVFNPRTPFILHARQAGIPVVSEVELAWALRARAARTGRPAPWIGITGTNGKTSTTQMTSAMMTASGFDAPAVGNIGKAVSQAVLDPAHDVLCVELSSFQLHFTDSLSLACAAITNLAADHLDWHGGFEAYAADKAKIYHGVQRALVYNADDRQVSAIADAARPVTGCLKVGFTLGRPAPGQIGVRDGWIIDLSGVSGGPVGQEERIAPLSDLAGLSEPDGSVYPHLLADALCAFALALGAGADRADAVGAMAAFRPGDHRIETVTQLGTGSDAIRFVDDSKATNAHAARASLSSYRPGSVIWIAGGLAKGTRFDELVASQADCLAAVVVIGQDPEPIMEALSSQAPQVPVTRVEPKPADTVMERAVRAAGEYAQPGQVVLLAPACASMDQFRSYADRGKAFARQAAVWVDGHAAV